MCYVNPARPERAVLERDFTWDNLLGLFPLLFVVVGLGGIIWACRSFLGRRTPDKFAKRDQFPERAYPTTPDARFGAERYGHRESIFDDDDSDDEDDEGDEFLPQRGVPGPVTLRPESSRLASFLVVLFFGTFWNGITSIFVVQTAADFARGNPRWLMMLLLTPFVLIGVLLIVGIFHTFLSLFNPRPEITLSSGDLSLGDEVELRWRFIGSTRSIRNLQIRLKGIEKAVYRRGTSTHTDTHTFADILIVETDDPMRIAEGSEILKLPSDTMHSFTANHNEINWALSVVGSIAFWPDIKDTFPIVIHPAPPRA